jgi:hypothetical protein
MKTLLTDPRDILRALPEHLKQHGWCQLADKNGEGAMCFRGAVADLANGDPSKQTGYAYEATMSAFALQVGTNPVQWNDKTGNTETKVSEAALLTADAWESHALTVEQLADHAIPLTNQLQIDQALELGHSLIVLTSEWTSPDLPSIETWGTSSPRIETWGTSSPSIVTRGTSSPSIVTRESSIVVLLVFTNGKKQMQVLCAEQPAITVSSAPHCWSEGV